jgi:hypothetical protein
MEMLIQSAFIAAGICLFAGAQAFAAGDIPATGDTYIISRDDGRTFRGSHRIYNRASEGLVEVKYCGRSYWVRYATVAWTQLEVEQQYVVRVEYNRGKGWRPICNNPDKQVTLHGLGVSEDARVVMQNDGVATDKINRFAAISESFSPSAGEDTTKSFHGN